MASERSKLELLAAKMELRRALQKGVDLLQAEMIADVSIRFVWRRNMMAGPA